MEFTASENIAKNDLLCSNEGVRGTVRRFVLVDDTVVVTVQTDAGEDTWVLQRDEMILRSSGRISELRDSAEITVEITAPLLSADEDITNPFLPHFECWE